jgi:hypothetical protein
MVINGRLDEIVGKILSAPAAGGPQACRPAAVLRRCSKLDISLSITQDMRLGRVRLEPIHTLFARVLLFIPRLSRIPAWNAFASFPSP